MSPSKIRAEVQKLNSRTVAGEENAWLKLRDLGVDVVPYLLEAYPTFSRWQGRVSLVFHSIRYARVSDEAFQLGLLAIRDRATLVRYRGCCVLAYSLRKDALPHLMKIRKHPDEKTAEDARVAVKAIRKQNHHLFMDRLGSGSTFWTVNPGDRDA